MKKQKPICSHCRGGDLLFDAYAAFDTDTQEYVIQTVFDSGVICENCEGETSIEWVEHIDIEVPARDPGTCYPDWWF